MRRLYVLFSGDFIIRIPIRTGTAVYVNEITPIRTDRFRAYKRRSITFVMRRQYGDNAYGGKTMKTRAQIYSQEAAGILRDISMYRILREGQLLRLYPGKEAAVRNLLAYPRYEGDTLLLRLPGGGYAADLRAGDKNTGPRLSCGRGPVAWRKPLIWQTASCILKAGFFQQLRDVTSGIDHSGDLNRLPFRVHKIEHFVVLYQQFPNSQHA